MSLGRRDIDSSPTCFYSVSHSQRVVQLVEDVGAGQVDPPRVLVDQERGEVVAGVVLELRHQSPHPPGEVGGGEEEEEDKDPHVDHLVVHLTGPGVFALRWTLWSAF